MRSFYDASIEPFINRDRSDSKTGQSSLVTRFCVVSTERLDAWLQLPTLSHCAIHFKLTEVRLRSFLAARTFCRSSLHGRRFTSASPEPSSTNEKSANS